MLLKELVSRQQLIMNTDLMFWLLVHPMSEKARFAEYCSTMQFVAGEVQFMLISISVKAVSVFRAALVSFCYHLFL